MKKSIVTRSVVRYLSENLLRNLLYEILTRFLYFDSGLYKKSYYLKNSLNAVKNTPAPEIGRLFTCRNCEMICKPYCWDKQHTNMIQQDRLINGYALLLENDVSFFWVFLTPTHRLYQHETIFVWYFWIVKNTFKIYFWDISEKSENKHLFWDMFQMP